MHRFETFPILRWLLLLAALAPLILAWIMVRGHKLSWAPGELTMVVGFAAIVLIGYNGIIDKPAPGAAEIGISLDYGYWLALLASIAIAGHGLPALAGVGQKRSARPRARSDRASWSLLEVEIGVSSPTTCARARSRTATSRWSSSASPRPRRWPPPAGWGAARRRRPTRPPSTRCG